MPQPAQNLLKLFKQLSLSCFFYPKNNPPSNKTFPKLFFFPLTHTTPFTTTENMYSRAHMKISLIRVSRKLLCLF